MYAHRDFRPSEPDIKIEMTLREFRETVEWLESLAPENGATHEWRRELDRTDPRPVEEESHA